MLARPVIAVLICLAVAKKNNSPTRRPTVRTTSSSSTTTGAAAAGGAAASAAAASQSGFCGAGTYKRSVGGTCASCPVDKYSSTSTSSNSCTHCPGGKYTTRTGSSNCDLCPTGKFKTQSATATACTTCAADTYQHCTGSTFCRACGLGCSADLGGGNCVPNVTAYELQIGWTKASDPSTAPVCPVTALAECPTFSSNFFSAGCSLAPSGLLTAFSAVVSVAALALTSWN